MSTFDIIKNKAESVLVRAHLPGDGILYLLDASNFVAPTTITALNGFRTIRSYLAVTAVDYVNNTLAVSGAVDGSTDVTLSINTQIANWFLDKHYQDHSDAIVALQTGGTGSQGPQGNQGYQGSAGQAGVNGSQGYQGNAGQAGAIGSQGYQGANGSQGYQGYQGANGQQGYQGANGSQGYQGANGSQGYQGANGSQGHQGYQGNTGVGTQGSQGYQGASGGGGGGGGVQGVNKSIQYNNAGTLAGSSNVLLDDTNNSLHYTYSANGVDSDYQGSAISIRDDNAAGGTVRRGLVLDRRSYTFSSQYLRVAASANYGNNSYNEVSAIDVGHNNYQGEIRFFVGKGYVNAIGGTPDGGFDTTGNFYVNTGFKYLAATALQIGYANAVDPLAIMQISTQTTGKGLVVLTNQYGNGNPLEIQIGPNGGAAISWVDPKGAWHPPNLADSAAQPGSTYYSIDQGKLCFKDPNSTVFPLY